MAPQFERAGLAGQYWARGVESGGREPRTGRGRRDVTPSSVDMLIASRALTRPLASFFNLASAGSYHCPLPARH